LTIALMLSLSALTGVASAQTADPQFHQHIVDNHDTVPADISWAFQQSLLATSIYTPQAQHILKPLPVDGQGDVSVATATGNVEDVGGQLIPKFIQNNQLTGDVWISAGTELKDRVGVWTGTPDGLKLRVREILGLRPESNDDYVVTMTVKGADAFRPTPNPDTSTKWSTGDAPLPPDQFPEVPSTAPAWYVLWFANNMLFSYRPPGYPWTHLGYTYDWKPGVPDHYGVSEYVIKSGAAVITWKVQTIKDYFSAAQ
jgi:hypothetical protein